MTKENAQFKLNTQRAKSLDLYDVAGIKGFSINAAYAIMKICHFIQLRDG